MADYSSPGFNISDNNAMVYTWVGEESKDV